MTDFFAHKTAIPHWLIALLGTISVGIFSVGMFYASVGTTQSTLAGVQDRVHVIQRKQTTLMTQVDNQGLLISNLAKQIDSTQDHLARSEARIAGIQATLKQINTRLAILIKRSN